MKLIFGNAFIFYTSSMYEICLHCYWLGFSCFILNFRQCEIWSTYSQCCRTKGLLQPISSLNEQTFHIKSRPWSLVICIFHTVMGILVKFPGAYKVHAYICFLVDDLTFQRVLGTFLGVWAFYVHKWRILLLCAVNISVTRQNISAF